MPLLRSVVCSMLFAAAVPTGAIAAPAATFVSADTATQGSWLQSAYGHTGYLLANNAEHVPPSVPVSLAGAGSWSWSGVTSDVRALQAVSGTNRIAATYYASPSFMIDVPVSDGDSHRVTLYLLDWDAAGRVQQIDALDATTAAVLDSRTISAFAAGEYLSWTVSGHVAFRVTALAGPNAVVSGVFIDAAGSGTDVPPTVTMASPGGPFTAPAAIPLSAAAQDADGSVTRVQFFANATMLVGTANGTSPATFTWTGVPAGSYAVTAVATDSDFAQTTSDPVMVTVLPGAGTGTTATYLTTDTHTQGSWKGVYGSDGATIIDDSAHTPPYATLAPTGNLSWIWRPSTTMAEALQKGDVADDRIAAAWYSPTEFSVDLNLTDGLPHQLALYGLDWGISQRSQRIDILDAATLAVLDSRVVSDFEGGQYWIYRVSGHIRIRFTWLNGWNAVLSGIFFDSPPGSPTVTVTLAPPSGPFTAPATIPLSATTANSAGAITQVQYFNGPVLLGTGVGTNQSSFVWTGVPAGTYSVTAVATDEKGGRTSSNAVSVAVAFPPGSGGASATYIKADQTTQGLWRTVYGGQGYLLVNNSTSLPAGVAVSAPEAAAWTWAGFTSDPRALQAPPAHANATGGVAATWYGSTTFTVDVNVTDGATHRLAAYFLDWDRLGRAESVTVLDAGGNVLDSRQLADFDEGEFLVWQISGHIQLRITALAGPNAVVSGLLFDAP